MGIFGIAVDLFDEAISAAVDFVREVLPPVARFVAQFISEIPSVFVPVLGPEISAVIKVLTAIIGAVAEFLVGKPKEERPEELGMKASRCKETEGMSEEDFNSTEEYVRYLRERYPIDERDLEQLDDAERQKYALTGIALYSQELGEKYGMELGPRFWRAVRETGLQDPVTVDKLLVAMRTQGVTSGDVLDSFLCNELPAGSQEREGAYDALETCLASQGEKEPAMRIDELITSYGEKVK